MKNSKIVEGSIQLYTQGKYQETLDYIKKHYDKLQPDVVVDNILICTLSKLGKADEAINELDRSFMKEGFWCMPEMLEKDPDLANISNHSKFKEVIKICKERYENHRFEEPYMEMNESDSDELFMMLHGNQQPLEELQDRFNKETMSKQFIAFPRASEQVMSGIFIWNDFDRSKAEVARHYISLFENYKLDPEKAICGAFSAGGTVLLENVIEGKMNVKKLLLIEPWLPRFEEIKDKLVILKKLGIRVYLISGDINKPLYEMAKTLAKQFEEIGIPYQFKVYEGMRHQIPEDIADLFPFIRQFLIG